MNQYQFKPLCEKDLDLLYHWFQEPVINQMYARSKYWSFEEIKNKYLPRIQGTEYVPSFIIYKDEIAIGYMQYYCLMEHFPKGVQNHKHPLFKDYNPKQLVGIDLFIAHEKYRGKSIGALLLNLFIRNFLMKYQAVIVDPEINNVQAIRSYEKAGFKKTTYSQDLKYLIMIKKLADIS